MDNPSAFSNQIPQQCGRLQERRQAVSGGNARGIFTNRLELMGRISFSIWFMFHRYEVDCREYYYSSDRWMIVD